MKAMPNESVDLIVTDPPFAIDFKARRGNYNRDSNRVLGRLSGNRRRPLSGVYRRMDARGVSRSERHRQLLRVFRVEQSERHSCRRRRDRFSGRQPYYMEVSIRSRLPEAVRHFPLSLSFFLPRTMGSEIFIRPPGSTEAKKLPTAAAFDTGTWKMSGLSTGSIGRGIKKPRPNFRAAWWKRYSLMRARRGIWCWTHSWGLGQVALISKMSGRRYIGFEIADEYFRFAEERLRTNAYRIKAEDNEGRVRGEVLL